MNQQILNDVSEYYTNSLLTHGTTARGVDWNGEASQMLRFEHLIKVIDSGVPFSVLDFGCGYGAMHAFLKKRLLNFNYIGFDISSRMIEAARELEPENENCIWTSDEKALRKSDYSIASGIFNVRLNYSEQVWQDYIQNALSVLDKYSVKGFAFNMLSIFSDPEYRRQHLYYADPALYFRHCMDRFSRYVALYHDYPLYEFTIAVSKETIR